MCIVCGSSGDMNDFIFCIDCGQCFHYYCLNMKKLNRKFSWRCPNCQVFININRYVNFVEVVVQLMKIDY